MKTMSNFPTAPESNILHKQKQSMATFIAVDKCFYTSSFDCRETNLPAIKTKLGNVGVEAYLTLWTFKRGLKKKVGMCVG